MGPGASGGEGQHGADIGGRRQSLATGALLAVRRAAAQAQRAPSVGAGTPWGQTGIQLYDFSTLLSNNGAGEITCPAPPAAADAELRRPAGADDAARRGWSACSRGCRARTSATSSSTATRATRSRRPRRAARATSPAWRRCARSATSTACASPAATAACNEANWDNQIAPRGSSARRTSASPACRATPPATTPATALLHTAQQLNRLGKRSVEAGLGPAYFHNHNEEFSRRYTDAGVSCRQRATPLKSAWEIIMDRTDPRWVVAQIDIGWAVCGSAFGTPPDAAAAQAYVTAMINKFTRPDRQLPLQGRGRRRHPPELRQRRAA